MTNFLDLVQQQVERWTSKTAFRFLEQDGQEGPSFSYMELDRQARTVAAALQAGNAYGQRVLLIYPPSLSFIVAFLGCLYAGAIAVPAYPPRRNHHLERLQAVIRDAEATFVLTTESLQTAMQPQFQVLAEGNSLHWIATDTLEAGQADRWVPRAIAPEHLAFLQYTSGSTGQPKGVMVSHDRLMHNSELIHQTFHSHADSVGVCWLPPYHDMGLIGGILQSLYVGATSVLMSPVTFLQRPSRWLEAITRYGVTCTGGPNFAYDLCAAQITPEQRQDLDLSTWKVAYTGAEPIRAETLKRFTETFRDCGFDPAAYLACYGMAETTLMVTGNALPGPPKVETVITSALLEHQVVPSDPAVIPDEPIATIVSCGIPWNGMQVEIVDPVTHQRCDADRIGEIWVTGDSVTLGYWQKPELTEATFRAKLADDPDRSFLRTGDLGFIKAGELFVTGRLKELILLHGRNYYPQDIECIVQNSHPALALNQGAAFSIEANQQEHLVIVQEVTRTALRRLDVNEVVTAIRRSISGELDLQVAAVVLLKPAQIPKTSSGKIQRGVCRQRFLERSFESVGEWLSNRLGLVQPELNPEITEAPETSGMEPAESLLSPAGTEDQPPPCMAAANVWSAQIQTWLVEQVATQLEVPIDEIQVDVPLANYGLSSLTAARLSGDLQDLLELSLSPTLLYDYPTIQSLADHLGQAKEFGTAQLQQSVALEEAETSTESALHPATGEIAIVGMACRFPGAENPDEFWQLLWEGQDPIADIPADRWNISQFYDPEVGKPNKTYVRQGGFLKQVDQFDAPFFRISAQEAASMDPQQRLLLEVTWEGLEHAGLSPQQLAGSSTGVFVGISSHDYARLKQSQTNATTDPYLGTSHAFSIAANRLSYVMDWHGPSLAIDTACSSSLVAVHQASQSLHRQECEVAIAGGINLILTPELTISFSQARMLSPEARCKSFDRDANGYVRSEGCGIVVLKRLEDAIRDRNTIYAVIKGSAVNQDGQSNGLMAPNGLAQQTLLRQALQNAQLQPQQVGYIEAHGTGTALGDPIEVGALKAVFAPGRPAENPLRIGTVKSSIGHLEAAAGVAGLIKTALALKHRAIPGNLHLKTVNPLIQLDDTALELVRDRQEWQSEAPRLAGVSSFGFGGTNAHVILAEPVLTERPSQATYPITPYASDLILLSAQNQAALRQLVVKYQQALSVPDLNWADLCHTTQVGRSHFSHRLAFLADAPAQFQSQIEKFLNGIPDESVFDGASASKLSSKRIAFVFTGQGSQYFGMGCELYRTNSRFRDCLDRCNAILEGSLPYPLLAIMGIQGNLPDSEAEAILNETAYTQPALFALEYALADLWQSWGVQPEMVMGHSLGEYVAACVAGVFSLEDGLKLVAERGRLLQSAPMGKMLAVFASEDQLAPILAAYDSRVNIAAFNAIDRLTLAGEAEAIDAIVGQLDQARIDYRPLSVARAFHCPLVEPILPALHQLCDQIPMHPPRLPFISNVTGDRIESLDADYWCRHTRQSVQFAAGMQTLAESGIGCCIEIGATPTLLKLKQQNLTSSLQWLPCFSKGKSDRQIMLQSLAQLYTYGLTIDWSAVRCDRSDQTISLPTYPFQRQRHWLPAALPTTPLAKLAAPQDRRSQLLAFLQTQVGRVLLGEGVELDPSASLLEIGADSINLLETIQTLQTTFDVKVTMRQLFEELTTLNALADYLDRSLPPEWQFADSIAQSGFPQTVSHFQADAQTASGSAIAPMAMVSTISQMTDTLLTQSQQVQSYLENPANTVLERIIHDQLSTLQQVMSQQLAVFQSQTLLDLNGRKPHSPIEVPTAAPTAPPTAAPDTKPVYRSHNQAEVSTIKYADRSLPLPLSFAQQRLWFLDQLEGENATYNMPFALDMQGELNLAALERTLNAIVQRHESLRTNFGLHEELPIQIIHAQRSITIPVKDLQQVPISEQQALVQAEMQTEAQQPFHLGTDALLRLRLLRLTPDHHILLVTLHHIIADTWSIGVFIREVMMLYSAEVAGHSLQLPPLAVQYADYAVWQRQWLTSPSFEQQLAYWQQQLADAPPLLELPTDRPRPAVQTFRGGIVRRSLPISLTQQLQQVSQAENCTLFMTLLAGFQILLRRYSGQSDILVGTPIANRDRSELKPLIGFLVNTLVLRNRFLSQSTGRELLHQVRQVTLEAYDRAQVPFDQLVDALRVERSLSYTPLVQVMFVLQNVARETLRLPGLSLTTLPTHSGVAQFDLTLSIDETESGLVGEWEYNSDLFNASTIERMATHFQTILEQLTHQIDQPIDTLPLLTHAAQRQILEGWNQTANSSQQFIHEWIEQQAQKTPDAIALTFNETWLSYHQLNQQANQLAQGLRQRGVNPGDFVGLYLERGMMQIVAIVAILKAGGAYVPLDPTYPIDRLRHILKDAQPKLIVSDRQQINQDTLQEILKAGSDTGLQSKSSDLPIVYVDDDCWTTLPTTSPAIVLQPDHPAYIIYTSGSTGTPKGVVIPHHALAHFVMQAIDRYGLTAQDRMLQFASVNFDAAVEEIFPTLVTGATLVVRSAAMLNSMAVFQSICQQQQLTVLDLPTAFWHAWVSDPTFTTTAFPSTVRLVIIGGEKALSTAVQQWQQVIQGRVQLFNTYGPTEATVVATTYAIGTEPLAGEVPIGQPLPGVTVRIVNEMQQSVPLGVPGELYLGGACLATGYLNRPDLTADKFVQLDGQRFYRTGDRVRQNQDGQLEYLGRLDNQVKVRGFRVELGEIESVLSQHEAIAQVVVAAHEDYQGVQQLVAYYTPIAGMEVSPQQIRSFAQQQLPHYMVPALCIALPEFPLTPTGKIDRRALPTPSASDWNLPDANIAPRTETEATIANLVAQVLKLEQVSVEADFFAIGGHSLAAMQVIGQIHSQFNVELSVRQLFEQPTVAGLAAQVEAAQAESGGSGTATYSAIVPVDRSSPLPLSFAQQRMWLLEQLEGTGAAYHMAFGQRLQGDLRVEILQQCWHQLEERHEALRMNFEMVGEQVLQKISPASRIVWQQEDWRHQPDRHAQIEIFAKSFAQQPFDLTQDCLVRISLVQLEDQEYFLTMVFHHLIADGWSTGILIQEFMLLYAARTQGQVATLPELPVQYIDFAQWQRQSLQGERLQQLTNYWQQQLANLPEVLNLPIDRPRPLQPTFRGAWRQIALTPGLTGPIDQLSQQTGATRFMILLSAFVILLHRYSGQLDLTVGSPIANRAHPEVANIVGLMLNTLVLRFRLETDATFESVLRQVQQTTLDAYSHQDLPFEQLAMLPEHQNRPRSISPWFQVMFILQNANQQQLELPGLRLTHAPIDMGVAKFDITLSVEETPQGFVGAWEYNADLFDTETIDQLAFHFEAILAAGLAKLDGAIGEIPLEAPPVTTIAPVIEQATDTWSVVSRMAAQAQTYPNALAIVDGDRSLTYGQLEQQANQLAQGLRQRGVGPGDFVGLYLERGMAQLVAIVAILKAGGAYVPLDPTYPIDRLRHILKDAQPKLIISDWQQVSRDVLQDILRDELDRLSQSVTSDLPIVCVDDSRWATLSTTPPAIALQLDHPAYVIYTSGSTGTPKGVVIPHRALAHFVTQAIDRYGLTAQDRMLQFASVNFDAAVEEIFPTLVTGATLVVRSAAMLNSMAMFQSICQQQQLTVLDLPTAFWHAWVSDPSFTASAFPNTVRLVIIGGEKALPTAVQQWQQVIQGRVQLFNTYGPTEATVVATTYAIGPEPLAGEVPIGQPLPGVTVRIVNEMQQSVPLGVPGELYLGGACLATGYLNRPDLTTDKFVQLDGQRFYRTGDRVRQRRDGQLEYLGRLDNQVKVRGFRVELGEVESVLSQHEAIAQVVVAAHEDFQGVQQLVAYYTPMAGMEVSPPQIRSFAQQQLPPYMVPALCIALTELPLTPTGKIDRRALPTPSASDWTLPEADVVAPRTETEAMIANLVAKVLKLEQVSVEADFFVIGGHSLAAMQLIGQIRSQFSTEISLRQLFEQPTVAGLAAQVEAAQAESGGSGTANLSPIVPIDRSQPLPVSFAQQRLWFLDQLEGESATYNMPFALEMQGELNLAALERTLNTIVQRHESLRTNFGLHQELPVQIIHDQRSINIPVKDLQQISAAKQQALVQVEMQTVAQQPFHLETDSLLRFQLLRLSPENHVLLVTMHHIIADAWSIGVFIREVVALYEAEVSNNPVQLPLLEIQYADYAVWQREWLASPNFQQQLAYWQQQLADVPPLLELPTDRPRPAVQTFRGGMVRRSLPISLTQQLQQVSQAENCTLFMTLLTGFQILLHRYSGQSDVLVGSPIANRDRPELEPLIGFLINTLVLRNRFSDDSTGRNLLHQVRQVTLEAYEKSQVPFEKLVDTLQVDRSLSYTPLVQVMFVLQNAAKETLQIPGLSLTAIPTHSGVSRFDLTLSIDETESGLVGEWEYNADLFDPETIERMATHFQVILEQLAVQLDQPIATLPLLTPAEQQQILVDWNQTATDLPQHCIHEWIEKQVERTPDAIALTFNERQLTYTQLNQQANQLAHYLLSSGLQSEQMVGVSLDRSIELIVALLAIWKAGGVYVPLDPTYPEDRLAYMVQDSQLQWLITQAHYRDRFPGLSESVHVLQMETLLPSLATWPTYNPVGLTQPDHLAYLIYTSGSTGQPKGVQVEHRGLGNLAFAQIAAFQVQPESRVLQMASMSFDASISEVLMTLCAGARLCLGTWQNQSFGPELVAFINYQNISHATLPPSALAVLDPNSLPGLQHLIVAGEACPAEVATLWARDRHFYNAYGPTETSVCATIADCTASQGKPPIGRPISNFQLYVLDQTLQAVPIGVAGELYIGGLGVARGYLNRPELTAERFIINPFGPGRLYRTGDLVRWLPDGQLDYLGRIDQQIKLRGYRIELSEIEAVLRQHSAVREAVVILRQTEASQLLVAYAVPHENTMLNSAELRSFLQSRLPKYMLPTAVLFLESFPLSPNGKINRRALPAPAIEDLRQGSAYVAPRNSIEVMLVEMWAELLNLSQVGVTDNFFDLGGHSLLATQLIARIHKQFSVELSLQPLFESPTIASLAEQITAQQLSEVNDDVLEQLLADIESLSETDVEQLLQQS